MALECAEAALGDQEYVRRSREINDQGMQQLRQGLDQLGVAYIRRAAIFCASISAALRRPRTKGCCALV